MGARLVAALIVGLMTAPATALAVGDEPEPAASAKDGYSVETASKWTEKWGDLGPAYTAAVKLVRATDYGAAITALKALDKPKDPRVLNYLGFAHRKMGKPQAALPYYRTALEIAPDYTPAREYLGEAYLQLGAPDKAKAELAEIEKLCGKDCAEYKQLQAAITAAAPKG